MSPKSLASFERREQERADTRNKILEAARQMFVRNGYEGTTMRGIADAIRYTPTALYHHFASKQALVTELCQHDFDRLARHFSDAARVADPIERIRQIGWLYLQFAMQYPNHYQFMFMTAVPMIEHRDGVHGNPERDAYAVIQMACRDAIERGRLRPELTDADEVAQILWATLHGLVSLRLVNRDQWVPWRDLEQSAEEAIHILTRGITRTAD